MNTGKQKTVGMDLTKGSILKALGVFAGPIVLTNLIQQLYSLVDLMIIGHFLGSVGTVGVSTGGELADLVTPVATSFATAGQIYMAQLAGAQMKKEIKEATGTLLTSMAVVALTLMAAGIIFCRPILIFLNCPEEAMGEAVQYMVITCIGFPFIYLYNGVCGALRGMGESKRPLLFVMIAASINIVLDIVFVAALGWGVAGTAIATILAQFGSFIAAFIYMYKRKEHFDFEPKLSYFRINAHAFRIIMGQALPQIGRALAVHMSMLWVNAAVNSFGLVVSATNSVGNKIIKFLNVFVVSVTQASGAIIGQNLGAGKKDRAARVVWTTFAVSFTISCVMGLAAWFCPKLFFSIFTKDQEVIDYGVIYMHILILHFFASAFTSSFQAIVTGCGFASLDFAVGIMDGIVCRVGFSVLFAYVMGMGAEGFFWGTAVTRVIPGMIVFIYFMSGKWRTRKLLTA